jgi:hypothetical protein
MFTFFHRRKKIVVDCFTDDIFAFEYAPIVRGSKAFPDWWTKLPISNPTDTNFSIENKNMRKCYGFLELFKRSIIIPAWTDLRFKVTPNNGYTWLKSSGPEPVEHNKSQYEGGFSNYYHSKLTNPWYFKEKTGVHFLFTASTWNLENYDFIIPPGILEFKYNHATNVNILIPKKKEDYSFFLSTGKPLVHLIPIENSKIDLRIHLVTPDEMKKTVSHPSSLTGVYPLFEMRNKQKKCPFGFGR